MIDLDVLTSFVDEVRGYLPHLRSGSEAGSHSGTSAILREAHRCAHTMQGSASLVGFQELHRLGLDLERAFEDVPADGTLSPVSSELCLRSIDAVERYLDALSQASADGLDVMSLDTSDLELLSMEWQERRSAPTANPLSELESETPREPEPPTRDADSNSDAESISAELMEVFSLEAEEHLRVISSLLPAYQQDPANTGHLQEIRRSAHTLKGSAAMVGYEPIKRLAHRMEDLLDLLADGQLQVNPGIFQLLFATSDALEDLATGKAPADPGRLYQQYADLLTFAPPVGDGDAVPAHAESDPSDAFVAPVPTTAGDSTDAPIDDGDIADLTRKAGNFLRMPIDRLDEIVKLVGELVISRSEFEQRLVAYTRQLDELGLSTGRLSRVANKLESQYEAKALGSNRLAGLPGFPAAPNAPAAFGGLGAYGFDSLEFDRYSDFHLLTRELSESASDIRAIGTELGALDRDFESYLTRQTRLSSELQEKLMRVRMVPLVSLGNRLQRTVRNAATVTGKQARLLIDGGNTELDKTVLEEMSEPLLHLLRNAVDHGIEFAEARKAHGKPETGTVRVRAFPEGTRVVIRVEDDGAGIDPDRLRVALVERGLVADAETAARLSPAELYSYLFVSGFSTARSVSEISGRGVGLDVVKTMVNRLKGTLSVDSVPGRGTTFTIRLPLTLAVMRVLLVRAGGQSFAVPLGSVSQITRLEDGALETIGEEPVIRVAGKVHPVVRLSRALKLKGADESVARPPVIVLNIGDRQIALIVDSLLGGREIVVKNLGNHIRQLKGIAGATLMGDGTVVLILNPGDLFEEHKIEGRRIERHAVAAAKPKAERRASRRTILLVDDSPSVRRIVSLVLRNGGWQTTIAKDGVEALETLNQGDIPDAIVLDIEMPRMDGYELLSTIRASATLRGIPVVMATSRAGDKHRNKAMQLGASAYLVKPYQEDLLLKTLDDLTSDSSGSEAPLEPALAMGGAR
jgi:chemosensory pili system protein ChpA (sensor histidine kinase/response regulator)